MINYNEVFNKILESSKKSKDVSKDYLKSDIIGNTIIGRFIPNVKNPENSVLEYFHHGWKSKLDNSGIFILCPNTYHEKCPVCGKSVEMWKSSDPVKKELSKFLRRRQNWLTNFYVQTNPKNKEDDGKLKIFRFGKQIHDKYKSATEGDDVQYYGERIFRLDDQGCSFRIKCEQNSTSKEAWPTYNNSSFLPHSAIEGMTPEKIEELHNTVHDLMGTFKKSTHKEILDIMDKHFFCNEVSAIPEVLEAPKQTVQEEKATVAAPTPPKDGEVTDSTIDDMLKDLV